MMFYNLSFQKNLIVKNSKMNRNILILVYRGQLHFTETCSRRKVISDAKFTELTLKVLSKLSTVPTFSRHYKVSHT